MNASSALLVVALFAAQAAPPAPPPDQNPTPDGPVVVLDTTLGMIKIGLFKTKSPLSTENFLRYVREGFFAGTIFHRSIPGLVPNGGVGRLLLHVRSEPAALDHEAGDGPVEDRPREEAFAHVA